MPNAALETAPPRLKSPDELLSKELADAYRAWRKLANGRSAPSRREISPKYLKPVLATAFLLDVIGGGADFRLSLGGDKILRFLMNRLSPGMLLSETSGSVFHERTVRLMKYCVDSILPIAAGPSQVALEGREFLSTEVLVLPLSDDGKSVTSLIGAIHISPLKQLTEPSVATGLPKAFPARASS